MKNKLLRILRGTMRPHPTLYLIWHYVYNDQLDLAKAEFQRAGDKFPLRCLIQNILYKGEKP
jgi:hypothetical protein